MKFLILIYSNPENWSHPVFLQDPAFKALPDDERAAVTRAAEELRAELAASGELVSGAALADPGLARTLRGRDGVPVATDGPFGEAKEELAGIFVIDCAGPERAERIAARFPEARFGAVEVRPIMDLSGQEM